MPLNYLPLLFNKLNNQNIEYSVLRNYQQLPDSTGGSDLDLLIHEKDVQSFNMILNTFIKSNSLQIVSVILEKRCPKYCILNEHWGIQIDVFQGNVYYGRKELISSKYLFKNTQNFNGIKVLNGKAGSVLSFLKELLNNKKCDNKYIEELKLQFQNQNIEPELLEQFNPKFSQILNKHLFHLNDEHQSVLHNIAKKDFKRFKFSDFKNKIGRLVYIPGYTIAFLGTDGSGKSTIINIIQPLLNKAFHKKVYYEHMRPNQIPSIARLLGKKEQFNGPVTNPHEKEPSKLLVSLIRWGYYMIDYTLGYYLKVFPTKAIRSCVWIFDRYYYDYLIDPKRGRINLPQWILKLGQLIIPEPDIIICLGADSETIHNRKPELTLKEVERQVIALKLFCQSHKKAVWVDTGKSIDKSSNEALNAIIKVMGKRFESVKLS